MSRDAGIDRRLVALQGLLDSDRPRSALETACIHRQIRDLENVGQNGLIWDEEAAQRVVTFCGHMRHWKGEWAGRPFVLEPWQEQLAIAPLFGWYVEAEDGLKRRFTVGYDEEPRKNGKTFKAAAIALQGLMADREQGAEVYTAASTRDQASIIFRDAQNVVRNTGFAKHLEFYKHSIMYPAGSGVLKPVSSEANTLHGHNIHRAVIDELHTQPNRDLWDVIQTGTAARRNPLVFAITTAGHDRSSICFEQHEYARNVLEGTYEDDSYFAFIASAEADDDPFDPATWWKANPNLDISIKSDYLAKESRKAKTSPSYENTFRRLHLNQWTEQAVRWLPMHVWDMCCGPMSHADQAYYDECLTAENYAALDLASTRDVNALIIVSKLSDGRRRLLPFFWVPEEAKDDAGVSDRRQVMNWAASGLIRTTPGNVADHDVQIPDEVFELLQMFAVKELRFDPWSATGFTQGLVRRGMDHKRLVEFRQTVANFADPTREFERLILAGKIEHGNHPVMRWMASNATVKVDQSGNLRPDKAKSSGKIDGIVAAIMALSGTMMNEQEQPKFWVPGSLAL